MKSPKFKWYIYFGFGVLFLFFFYYRELIAYGLNAGFGQAKILFFAQKNQVALNSKKWSSEEKRKIKLIQDVKIFAVNELGLIDNGNYESIYDQQGKPLVWVVTACKPYAFEEKKWHFPFVGNLSYKGFFNWQDANHESINLKKQGWETGIGKVSGWSTLGWFKDPILSSMLSKEDGNLVALIIHEMVHGTIYLGNNVEFSENIADFIGNKGAQLYFKSKKLKHSEKEFNSTLQADLLMNSYYLSWKDSLNHIYKTSPPSQLESQKRNTIRNIYQGIFKLPISKERKAKELRNAKWLYLEGNDFLMSYVRYGDLQDSLENVYRHTFNNDINRFIEVIKTQQH